MISEALARLAIREYRRVVGWERPDVPEEERERRWTPSPWFPRDGVEEDAG